ncbi:MAG: DUF4382 domain-containing protein [Nitrososphaerota archaeon]|nr:DUF4382 domain-containing protein [Nitrososphaerota archaeon]
MSSKRNVLLSGTIAGLIAIALIVAAMFVPGSNIVKSSSQSGTLGIQLTDPPVVPKDVSAVYISYSEMAVHVSDAGNNSGWYQVAPAGEIDLMSLLNTSVTLGSSQVTSGVYNAIGFNLTSATVTANGANQSAFISNDRMTVPIAGDLQVQSGESQGVLVDLSPTVIAIHNDSQTAYLLIPNAHILHVPASVWKQSDHKGDVLKDITQQQWFREANQGQISLSNIALSSNSMQVTVTNTGSHNASISLLSVAYPINVVCAQYQNTCRAPTDGHSPGAIPVGAFAVLSNGSLYQINITASQMTRYNISGQASSGILSAAGLTDLANSSAHVGYLLMPGQSVTLTFTGPVDTITPYILNYLHVSVAIPQSLMNDVSTINSGQMYIMSVWGSMDTFASQQLTAS